MKVVCPGCHGEFAVDDNRIPPQGLQVRCPKCFKAIEVGGGAAPASDLEAQLGVDLSGPSGEPAEEAADGWDKMDPLSTSDISMIGTYSKVGERNGAPADQVWSEEAAGEPTRPKAQRPQATPAAPAGPKPQPAPAAQATPAAPAGPRPQPAPAAPRPQPAESPWASVDEPSESTRPEAKGLKQADLRGDEATLDEELFRPEGTLPDAEPAGIGLVESGPSKPESGRDEDAFPDFDLTDAGGASQPIPAPSKGKPEGISSPLSFDMDEPTSNAPSSEEAPDSIFAIEERSGVFKNRLPEGPAEPGPLQEWDLGTDGEVGAAHAAEPEAPVTFHTETLSRGPTDTLGLGAGKAVNLEPQTGGGPTLDDIDFASLLDDVPGDSKDKKGTEVFFVDSPSMTGAQFEAPKSSGDSFSMEEITFDDLDSLKSPAAPEAGKSSAAAAPVASGGDDLFELDMGAAGVEASMPKLETEAAPRADVRADGTSPARTRAVRKKASPLVAVTIVGVLIVGGYAAFELGLLDGLLGNDRPEPQQLVTKKQDEKKSWGPRLLASIGEMEERVQSLLKEIEIRPDRKIEVEEELFWTLAWYKFLFPSQFAIGMVPGGDKETLPARLDSLRKSHADAVFKIRVEAMELAADGKWAEASASFRTYLDTKSRKMAELLEKNQITPRVVREDNVLSAWLAVENGRLDEADAIVKDLIAEKAGELHPGLLDARIAMQRTAVLLAEGKKDEAKTQRNRALDRLKDVVEQYPQYLPGRLLYAENLAGDDKVDAAVQIATETLEVARKEKNFPTQIRAYRVLTAFYQKQDQKDKLVTMLEEMKTAIIGKKTGVEEPEDLLMVLCRLYIDKGKLEQALGALELCGDRCSSADFYLLHATVYERNKLYNTAIDKAKKGLEKYPGNVEILLLLARLSKATDQTNSAVAYLQQILDVKPDNIKAALTLANLFLDIKDPSNARRVLIQAEKYVDNSLELEQMLAQINEAMGDDAGTIAALTKIIEIKDDLGVRKKLAAFLVRQGSYQEAIKHFEILESKGLITPDLRQAYAKSLKATGKVQEAVDVLKQLFKDNPGDVENARFLAEIYLGKEDFFNARIYLEAARRADSKDPEIHFLVGKCCLRLQDNDCALDSFRQAAQLAADRLEYLEAYANQLFDMSRAATGTQLQEYLKEARKYFDFIIKRYDEDASIPKDKRNADVYFNRGRILFETGHYDQARKDLENAMSLATHRIDILVTYADTLFKMNRYDDALKYFQDMVDGKNDPAHAWFYIGSIHMVRNKTEAAKQGFLNCIELEPKAYPDAHRYLGRIFQEKGMRQKAYYHYKTYLDLVGGQGPAAEEVRAAIRKL
jgi:predicted Zn finger-like uncharacterized protein